MFILNRSVIKYGKQNFEFFIIEIIENKENIREKERFFINILKTLSTEKGFNISNQTLCIPHNKETRSKIGKALKEKYENDSVFREKMKNINAKRQGKPSWNLGLKCENISTSRKEIFDDIEVYDLNMNFFRKFDNSIEIEKFSRLSENDLPIPDFIEFVNEKSKNKKSKKFLKNKIVLSPNIHRAIRLNNFYKGLFFKKVKRNG